MSTAGPLMADEANPGQVGSSVVAAFEVLIRVLVL